MKASRKNRPIRKLLRRKHKPTKLSAADREWREKMAILDEIGFIGVPDQITAEEAREISEAIAICCQ